jgi:hypothetical protein
MLKYYDKFLNNSCCEKVVKIVKINHCVDVKIKIKSFSFSYLFFDCLSLILYLRFQSSNIIWLTMQC